jgi:tape measure domain-containing protein
VPVAVVDVQVKGGNAVNQLRQINNASRSAQTGIDGLQKAVVGLAGAIGAVGAAKFVFVKTAELESQARSLQVLTGSVRQAKEIIEDLQRLGAVTPFTSTELIDAAKRLQAFGVEGDRVVEVTRRLADASGATGAELQGIVTAYGQVVAKGRLQGEELLQFQERGIGLQQELQKMYGLSGQELQDALSKGRISAEAVEVAIQRLTSAGGKYANGAVAQSDTLSGRLSTLQDGVDQLARRIGQVLTPALKAVFNQAIATVDAINQALGGGRAGGFAKSVFGARQLLNVGATSQAVDNIAKGIGQVSSQKNKVGIEQNLQALQKYQRLLQSIGPDDPNADRAVQLQGLILQKINQNIDAQKELNRQTKTQGEIFKIPELAAPTATKGRGRGAKPGKTPFQLQAEAGKSLLQQLQDQTLLATALTDEERKRLELSVKKQEIDRQFPLLSSDVRDILKEQLETLYGTEHVTASIKDLNEANAKKQADALKQQQIEAQRLEQIYAGLGQTIATGVTDMLTAAMDKTKSLAEVASNMLRNLANQLLQVAVNTALFSLFPGSSFFKGLPRFADGGSISGGKPAIVGERGPELFMPGRSGSIVPNNALGGNITVNVDATGTNVQGDAPNANKLGEALGAAVRAELLRQKRPGGLLA